MKKQLLLLFAALAISLATYAEHEYIPFLQEGNAWAFLNSVMMSVDQYSINGAVIGDNEYKVIYKTRFNALSWKSEQPSKWGYARESDGKVYLDTNQGEKIVYDFSLQKGDTAYWGTLYDSQGKPVCDRYVYVEDVYYEQIAGQNRKVLKVETCGVSLNEMDDYAVIREKETWIEGIGSTRDIFESEECRWADFVGPSSQYAYYHNYLTDVTYPENAELYDFITCYEHEYIPILSPSNEWVELSYQHYVQYTVGEKGELYGKNYYTINVTEMSLPDKAISHSTHNSLYREEDKKLYKLNVDEDFLVFDFGANAGDTVELKPLFQGQERKIVIDSIKTTTLNGKERNVFYVHYISNYGDDDDVWIEGIGPIHSFLFNEIIRWGGAGYSYFHYYYDNSTQYVYPEDRDVLDFSAVHATQSDAKSLTLHRNGDALMAAFPTAQAGEAITLYDATGRAVATQAVRQGATTANIDVATLPAGVYIARLNSGATAKVVL